MEALAKREYSPLSVGIAYLPFHAVLVAGWRSSSPGPVQAADAALVLLMTDHTRRCPASLGRSHAARILPRFWPNSAPAAARSPPPPRSPSCWASCR
jgi:hypothetical protein